MLSWIMFPCWTSFLISCWRERSLIELLYNKITQLSGLSNTSLKVISTFNPSLRNFRMLKNQYSAGFYSLHKIQVHSFHSPSYNVVWWSAICLLHIWWEIVLGGSEKVEAEEIVNEVLRGLCNVGLIMFLSVFNALRAWKTALFPLILGKTNVLQSSVMFPPWKKYCDLNVFSAIIYRFLPASVTIFVCCFTLVQYMS